MDDNALAVLLGLGGIKTGLPPGPRPSTNIEGGPANLLPGEAPMFTPGPMANDPSFGMSWSPPTASGTAANSPMAQGAGVNDIDTAVANSMMHRPLEKVWRDLPAPAPYSGPALTPTGQLAPFSAMDPAQMIPQALGPIQARAGGGQDAPVPTLPLDVWKSRSIIPRQEPARPLPPTQPGERLAANEQGVGSDMEGIYTPLTPEEHEGLIYDTPVVSSKGGGPTKEDVQEMLDRPQAEHDAYFNEMQQFFKEHKWGMNANDAPSPEGRIRGWKDIPGFQEYMKNLPDDVTVHDMKDGTIIFQKKKLPPVPTS
jgi:hypothetical protein